MTALAMQVTTGALLWLALVRASWVSVNAAQCNRSHNSYYGDCSYYRSVFRGNPMAQTTVFLVLLAMSKAARATLENPLGNHCCIPSTDGIDDALGMVRVYGTSQCLPHCSPTGGATGRPSSPW